MTYCTSTHKFGRLKLLSHPMIGIDLSSVLLVLVGVKPEVCLVFIQCSDTFARD